MPTSRRVPHARPPRLAGGRAVLLFAWFFSLALAGCGADSGCDVDADCAGLEDGDQCNGTLRCDKKTRTCGVDPATRVVCKPGDGGPCVVNTCAPATGECAPQSAPDLTPCDDGDACTGGDTCVSGACAPGNEKRCACKADADCLPWEDGDACNGTLRCDVSIGNCVPKVGSSVACSSATDTACAVNTCQPSDGTCVMKPTRTGLPCSDGDPCSEQETCSKGTCTGGVNTCFCGDDDDCAPLNGKCSGTHFCDKTVAPYRCKVNLTTVVSCPTKDVGPCHTYACDAVDGACKSMPLLDGSACDDGAPCTAGETCSEGTCQGGVDTCTCTSQKDCEGLEDGNLCNGVLYCDLATAKCKVNPKTVVACTKDALGVSQCVSNVCNTATGTCALTPVKPGTVCDDGNPCTVGEICLGSSCGKGTNTCACKTDSDCKTKDDSNVCNGVAFCNKAIGLCQTNPSTQVQCPSVGDTACTKNTCIPLSGACTATSTELTLALPYSGGGVRYELRPSGMKPDDATACDDGDSCTTGEICKAGSCEGGTFTCACTNDAACAKYDDGDLCNGTLFCNKSKVPAACEPNPKTVVSCQSVHDSACVKNQCKPATGKCLMGKVADGSSCDDGNPCTKNDFCSAAVCNGGIVVCPCQKHADCLAEDDGNYCNGIPYCDKTDPKKPVCKPNPASVVFCSKGQNGSCTSSVCNPATGKCVMLATNEGKTCDDATVCTATSSCSGGACEGAKKNCDDKDACTTDSCDAKKGCQHTKANCDDGNTCTSDVCDAKTGKCTFVTSGAQGTPCDADGNGCTIGDSCSQGVCKAGPTVPCSLKTGACEQAVCISKTATSFQCVVAKVPEGGACDDGDGCTVGDTCKAGKCLAGPGEALQTMSIVDAGVNQPIGRGAELLANGDAFVALEAHDKAGKVSGWATARITTAGVQSKAVAVTFTGMSVSDLVGSTAASGHWLAGTAIAAGGDTQLALAKVDPATGKTLKHSTLGNATRNERALALIGGPTGSVLAGWRAGAAAGDQEALVVQVTPSGQALWTWTAGKAGERVHAQALVRLADGTLLVAGEGGPAVKPAGDAARHVWLARLSTAGKTLWTKTASGSEGHRAAAVALMLDTTNALKRRLALFTQGTATNKGLPTRVVRFDASGKMGSAHAWTSAAALSGASGDGASRALLWGYIDPLGGTRAPWLARVTDAGTVQWQRVLSAPGAHAGLHHASRGSTGGIVGVGGGSGTAALLARLDAFGHASCQASGACLAMGAATCDDDEVCTTDDCGAKGCLHGSIEGAPCGDDTSCPGEGACASGACKLPTQGRLWAKEVVVVGATHLDSLAADAKGTSIFGRTAKSWVVQQLDPHGKPTALLSFAGPPQPMPINGLRAPDGTLWLVGTANGLTNGAPLLVHLDAAGKLLGKIDTAFLNGQMRFLGNGPARLRFGPNKTLLIFGVRHNYKYQIPAFRFAVGLGAASASSVLTALPVRDTSLLRTFRGDAYPTSDGGHIFSTGDYLLSTKPLGPASTGMAAFVRYTSKGTLAWTAKQPSQGPGALVARAAVELPDSHFAWVGGVVVSGAMTPAIGRVSPTGAALGYRTMKAHLNHYPEALALAPGGGLEVLGYGPTAQAKSGLWSARIGIDGAVHQELTIGSPSGVSVTRLPNTSVVNLPAGGWVHGGVGLVKGAPVALLARRDPWGHASCKAAGKCAELKAADCVDSSACTVDLCGGSTGCSSKTLGCNDGNPCTTDSCGASKGCAHVPLADGTTCGTKQQCKAGLCS